MKICLIISSIRPDGAERVLSILANYWVNNHEVVILQMNNMGQFYDLDPRIKIKTFHKKKIKKFTPSIHFKTIIGLYKTMKKINADVYISLLYKMNIQCILASLFCKIKLIVCEHSNHLAASKKIQFIRDILYRKANHVVVLTKYDLKYYQKYLGDNVSQIPNPNTFTPLQKKTPRENIILCVRRFNSIKNHKDLIQAVYNIKDSLNSWKIIFLEDGQERENIQNKIREYKLEKFIELKGNVKNTLSWYQKAKILVLCSTHEGFPMALTEAMSQGVTCISYDIITRPNEIINHMRDGILVKNKSIKQLSSKIKLLITKEDLRAKMAERAIINSTRLNINNINLRWKTILETI